jgi:hypothetical protein
MVNARVTNDCVRSLCPKSRWTEKAALSIFCPLSTHLYERSIEQQKREIGRTKRLCEGQYWTDQRLRKAIVSEIKATGQKKQYFLFLSLSSHFEMNETGTEQEKRELDGTKSLCSCQCWTDH